MSIGPQVACQHTCNSCTRAAIPEFRAVGLGELPFDQGLGGRQNGGGVIPEEPVGALGDGDGTLGVGPQCKTWNAEGGGLLLDPPAVGDEKARLIHETEEIEIAEG